MTRARKRATLIDAAESYTDRFSKRERGGFWFVLYDAFKAGAKWQRSARRRSK